MGIYMKYYITEKEMDCLENLAEEAMSVNTQKEEKKYIQKMVVEIGDIMGPSRNILNEMIASVENATGRILDKESKVITAKQQIMKAQMFCVEKQ